MQQFGTLRHLHALGLLSMTIKIEKCACDLIVPYPTLLTTFMNYTFLLPLATHWSLGFIFKVFMQHIDLNLNLLKISVKKHDLNHLSSRIPQLSQTTNSRLLPIGVDFCRVKQHCNASEHEFRLGSHCIFVIFL